MNMDVAEPENQTNHGNVSNFKSKFCHDFRPATWLRSVDRVK